MEKLLDRFLRYVAVDTQSNEESESQPSEAKELNLLRMLRDELQALGVEATLDEYGYVMATIPANDGGKSPKVGFIAHVDTAPDASGKDIKIAITKFMPPENPRGTWQDYNVQYADINANDWMNELVPGIRPLADKYPVYSKSVYSSMSIPALKEAALQAGRVVITGVVAECCVLFTAIDLIDLGCKLVSLTDACPGFTKEKEAATELVLKGLSPLHCLLMTTGEYEAEGESAATAPPGSS